MQPRIFFQILRQNQFSFFGSRVYNKCFSNSAESITWVKKMIEIAFINLIWSGIPSFNFQVDDSTLKLEDSLSNSGLQCFNSRIIWTWGIALELWASILNVRIQLEFEDSILNCRLEILILNLGFWIQEFRFWILDFGILDFGIRISGVRWGVWDFGLWFLFEIWILDFRFGDWGFVILEFGFWISILEFGIWIWGFGIWIFEFGFRILDLDLGFRILDSGFGILNFRFWFLEMIFGFGISDF